jgi:CelD/BcsL family acetyltransferase involved in cellulose biosynthesis
MTAQADKFSSASARPASLARLGAFPFTVETHADLSSIEALWRRFESSGISTIFQRYDWVDAYVRHVLPHEKARPAIVLGRLDGRPAFVLPLAIARKGPVRVASWIGGKHSSYNFGLWSPEAAATIARLPVGTIDKMLVGALDADCAVLARTPKAHQGVPQPLAGLPSSPSPTEGYSFALDGGFEAVLKRTDGAGRRRRVRTKERRMAEIGPMHYGKAHDLTQALAALDFFFEQKALRLAEQGKPNSFSEPGVKDFYRDLLAQSQAMDEPLLEMTHLCVDGRLRAVRGAGIHQGRLNGYFMTFARDDVVTHSPGHVLLFRHIEECCERGLNAYDLGVGYEEYKTHWCDVIHELDDVYAAFTPLGSAMIAAIQAGKAVKAHIRRHKALWQRLKLVQAYLSRHGASE